MRAFVFLLFASIAFVSPVKAVDDDICNLYRDTRLIVDSDLADESFVVREIGPLKLIEAPDSRPIYHRNAILSTETATPLALFKNPRLDTVYLTPDREQSRPFQIPVFYIGRADQQAEEFKLRAAAVRFGVSLPITAWQRFSTVTVTLRRGEWVGDKRLFFRCGLAGLLVCAGACPSETDPLLPLLLNAVAGPKALAALAKISAKRPPAEDAKPQAPTRSADVGKPAPNPVTTPTQQACPVCTVTPCPVCPTPPAAKANEPVPVQTLPPTTPSEKLKETLPSKSTDTQPQPQEQVTAKPPDVSKPTPNVSQTISTSERKSLVLRFVTRDGTPYPADDILEAEGRVVIAGVPMAVRQDALVADLPSDQFPAATGADRLRKLLLRHVVLAINPQPGEGNISLVVEPGYVPVRDLTVKVANALKTVARDCVLSLDVPSARQIGRGWDRIPRPQSRRLPLAAGPDYYRVSPATAAGVFILLQDDLPSVQLVNDNPNCLLAVQSSVEISELRAHTIARQTEASGSVLIAAVTTDTNMTAMLPQSIGGFWNKALAVYDRVASSGWLTKVLIRGQAPGVQINLQLLSAVGGIPLRPEDRLRTVALLNNASKAAPDNGVVSSPPAGRMSFPYILRDGRLLSGIEPRKSAGQESFLFISGSVQTGESDLCSFIRGQRPDNGPLDWRKPLQKAAFIELWDKRTAEAHAPSDATGAISPPVGVSLCRGQGDRSNLMLYGVNAALLANPETSSAIFAFLGESALTFLRP